MSDVYVLLCGCVEQDYPQNGLHSHYHIGVGLCSDCSQSPLEFVSSKVIARNIVLRQCTRPRRWIGQRNFTSSILLRNSLIKIIETS
jgi:hypothetical protein